MYEDRLTRSKREYMGNYMNNNKKIAGNKIRKDRHPQDYYPTPPKATHILIEHHSLHQHIWEPACGEGHISEILIQKGHRVKATDICTGVDIFDVQTLYHGDIVTNPPYSLALEFVEKCLDLTNSNVIMLLPLGFMTSAKRRELMQSGYLHKIIIIMDRLKIETHYGTITSQFNHAWYVFNKCETVESPHMVFV